MKNKFETFNDIEHMPLRVFNRVVSSFNIRDDFGDAVLEDYLSKFSVPERQQMMIMTMAIQSRGAEVIRKEVTQDLVLEDE